NGRYYTIPMAIEESSVVAAAGNSAKFWQKRGGFITEVLGAEKVGQVHFIYNGNPQKLNAFFNQVLPKLFEATLGITENMRKRGGGITGIVLKDKTDE